MSDPLSANIVWHQGHLSRSQRWEALGQRGATVWFTGLSGSGKSSVAVAVEQALVESGRLAYVLDGDNIRHGLNRDLGFGASDRDENVRRVAEVGRLLADAGAVSLIPLVSPYRAARANARALHEAAQIPFIEVFVDTPLAVCEQRDSKGLYAKARAGELRGFTGIDDPYEPPRSPELRLVPSDGDALAMAGLVLALLDREAE
ncbi:MAG: adenylyl-sulfate kinase [Acidimicrobiaceae bacterium]|nr:adenylyl-sulfate kinase [Acidimicrobiaceae bacterium]MXW74552.1 adenylyl-sulfate kinase [Acidimicrobiaceae bacterium]MYA75989.1 adenylyl-sulfate kinase [Acidimicrobiaceae bacterium]MYC43927.1 adenylyl-sulfate kinase [Acidimicrobiaceae bacterium]MYD07062.1 adenylyl-sulfate kinase [Acidimicrobiaceae bacterium]